MTNWPCNEELARDTVRIATARVLFNSRLGIALYIRWCVIRWSVESTHHIMRAAISASSISAVEGMVTASLLMSYAVRHDTGYPNTCYVAAKPYEVCCGVPDVLVICFRRHLDGSRG